MTFNEEYEEVLARLERALFQAPLLERALKKKRDFGIKKYGEESYQLSKENAMNVDTKNHAREELIDFFNYALHEIYKCLQRGEMLKAIEIRKSIDIVYKEAYLLFDKD